MKFKLIAVSGDVLAHPILPYRVDNIETWKQNGYTNYVRGSRCTIEFDTLEELVKFARTIYSNGCTELILGFDEDGPVIEIYDDYIE